MESSSYLAVVREESERILEALAHVPLETRVPTCEGWAAADLVWHLGVVQHFWSRVVAESLDGEDVPDPQRPDDAHLGAFLARSATELLSALSAREPHDECWSWDDRGHHVGWVARRQAHEALIHRVDAELTAGLDVTPPPVALAVDGIDEVLTVMIDGVPPWGTYTPQGTAVLLRCANARAAWLVRLGRFVGTGPVSGTSYDIDAALVSGGDGREPADTRGTLLVTTAADGAGAADAVVGGTAWDLDRWLWGRGPASALTFEGDAGLAEQVRELVSASTR